MFSSLDPSILFAYTLDIIALTVVIIAMYFSQSSERRSVLKIILGVYVLSVGMEFWQVGYQAIVDMLGFYVYISLFDLVAVLCLSRIKCRISFAVMVIALMAVGVNMIGLSIEALGFNPEIFVTSTMWVLWVGQLLIITSGLIENGFFRLLSANPMVNHYSTHYFKSST